MPTVDSNAWTTLANTKEHLQISSTDTSKDAFLTNLINRCYLALEMYLGRKIKSRDYTEYYDGDGTDTLLTDQWPINSVASLYDDINRKFDSTTLKATDEYVTYGQSEPFKIRLFAVSVGGGSLWSTFLRGVQNIKITYNAGYTTIPQDLEMACLIWLDHIYNKAGTFGHTSMSLGGLSKAFDIRNIPEEAKTLLEPYRKRAA